VPPVYATCWQELIPGARLTWIDGAAHMLPIEQPAAVAKAIGG
jgi:pimeloyl-ACP methyl ester carboxylesterase